MAPSKKWIPTSKHLEPVKLMPPRTHKKSNKKYDPNESDVLAWLAKHPNILEYVFEIINGKDGRREALISYDADAGTWQGVDYHA